VARRKMLNHHSIRNLGQTNTGNINLKRKNS